MWSSMKTRLKLKVNKRKASYAQLIWFLPSFEKMIWLQKVGLVYLATHKVFDTMNYGK